MNVGAAPNFNRAFELSVGTYFKWAASDDECGPDFLRGCVEVLDNDPSVVIAYPQAFIIDDKSRRVSAYESCLPSDSTTIREWRPGPSRASTANVCRLF